MYGVIDIGSNTITLSIYKVIDKMGIQPLFHKTIVAGLAGYVEKEGNLSEKGVIKAINTLTDFKKIAKAIPLKRIYVFATASLRNINNTTQVLQKITEYTKFDVEVISGEDEATYDFLGATYCMEMTEGVMVDIGGASTEFVFYEKGNILKALSIPVGSLNVYMKCVKELLPTDSEIENIKEMITGHLEAIELTNKEYHLLCGIGGSIRATCKLYNEFEDVSSKNREIKTDEIKKIIKRLKDNYVEILQIVPERIHTIIPGMVMLSTISDYYQCETMIVSDYGIREGYLINRLMQEEGNV